MEVKQSRWTTTQGWEPALPAGADGASQVVMIFGATHLIEDRKLLAEIREHYPHAHLLGCSTAGEIEGTHVLDNSLVATAVRFEHTELKRVSSRSPEPRTAIVQVCVWPVS